jgi:hypothetical protein
VESITPVLERFWRSDNGLRSRRLQVRCVQAVVAQVRNLQAVVGAQERHPSTQECISRPSWSVLGQSERRADLADQGLVHFLRLPAAWPNSGERLTRWLAAAHQWVCLPCGSEDHLDVLNYWCGASLPPFAPSRGVWCMLTCAHANRSMSHRESRRFAVPPKLGLGAARRPS